MVSCNPTSTPHSKHSDTKTTICLCVCRVFLIFPFSFTLHHLVIVSLLFSCSQVIVAGITLAAVLAFVAAGFCWLAVYRKLRAPYNVESGLKQGEFFPEAAMPKSQSSSSSDRRLAQSAQMYHYQHQKQQMIAMEK